MGEHFDKQRIGDTASGNPTPGPRQDLAAPFWKRSGAGIGNTLATERKVTEIMKAAFSLNKEKKYAESLEKYNEAIGIWPENPRIRILFFDRGVVSICLGKCAEALMDFASAEKAGYAGPRLHYEMGRAHLYMKVEGRNPHKARKRNAELAVENFNKAKNGGYEDLHLLFYRARANITCGRFQDAMPDADMLISTGEGLDRWAYFLRGQCRHASGDAKGALDDYFDAEKYEPKNPYLQVKMAEAYHDRGMPKEELERYEKARWLHHPNEQRLERKVSELKEKMGLKKE